MIFEVGVLSVQIQISISLPLLMQNIFLPINLQLSLGNDQMSVQ